MTTNYRKHNDGGHSNATYHKKEGTPGRTRMILKEDANNEIKEALAEIKAVDSRANKENATP